MTARPARRSAALAPGRRGSRRAAASASPGSPGSPGSGRRGRGVRHAWCWQVPCGGRSVSDRASDQCRRVRVPGSPAAARTVKFPARWRFALPTGSRRRRSDVVGGAAPGDAGTGRASAAEATAARSAAGVPSTRRGSRGSVTTKRVPLADPALDLDRAAVHVHDRADDRQPETAAAAAGLVRPRAAVEALEDVRHLGGVDADARVGHLDPCAVGRRRDVDRHRPAARRELDRVGDEVGDDLADARRIVADPDRRARAGGGRRSPRGARPRRGSARPPIRPRRAGRPAGGRAGPAPNRASTARAGSGRASRAARSAGRSTRGTRRAPRGRRRRPRSGAR